MSNDVKPEVKITEVSTPVDQVKDIQLKRELLMLRKAELENTQLEYQVQQMESRKETIEGEGKIRGIGLSSSNTQERIAFSICTHKKGGSLRNYPRGDGEHGGYAILRHRLPSGEIFIRCLRCGEEWLPVPKPVAGAVEYQLNGKFNEAAFATAMETYKAKMQAFKEALQWPTDNSDSAGPIWQFKDREVARAAFRGTNPPDNI